MAAALTKWKRAREEDGKEPAEPPSKRERGSSPEVPTTENDQLTDEKVFTLETCLTYVKEVKATFKEDAEGYQKFLKLMQDLQAKRVDIPVVITRVTELFQGHTHLILGFNMYLPEGYQITLPPQERPDPKMQHAIMFRRKVQALGKRTYKAFCEILHLFKEYNKSIDDVYKLAATLFADHSDLLAEFRTFLPALNDSISQILAQEPGQEPARQPARSPRKVRFDVGGEHPSANVRENEVVGESSRQAENARKGKEKMDTKNSKDAVKRKEGNNNREERSQIKDNQRCQPQRVSARNAERRLQAQVASNAAGTPPKRVTARTAARKPLPGSDEGRAPGSPPPSTEELLQRLEKCVHHCKICVPVEFPIFNWAEAREQVSYIEMGKASVEKERQALLNRGVAPGSNS